MPEDNFQLNTPALPGTVMPFSAEAEQAVLGAVLLEPDCLSTVAEMLPRADYFYQVNNRTIYSSDARYVHGRPAGGPRHAAGAPARRGKLR